MLLARLPPSMYWRKGTEGVCVCSLGGAEAAAPTATAAVYLMRRGTPLPPHRHFDLTSVTSMVVSGPKLAPCSSQGAQGGSALLAPAGIRCAAASWHFRPLQMPPPAAPSTACTPPTAQPRPHHTQTRQSHNELHYVDVPAGLQDGNLSPEVGLCQLPGNSRRGKPGSGVEEPRILSGPVKPSLQPRQLGDCTPPCSSSCSSSLCTAAARPALVSPPPLVVVVLRPCPSH